MPHEAHVDWPVRCYVVQWLRGMGSPGLDNCGSTDGMTWRTFCIEVVPQKHIQDKRGQARKRNNPYKDKAGEKNKYDSHLATFYLL